MILGSLNTMEQLKIHCIMYFVITGAGTRIVQNRGHCVVVSSRPIEFSYSANLALDITYLGNCYINPEGGDSVTGLATSALSSLLAGV